MPASLVAVAGHHHAPMRAAEPHRDLTSLVNLGANLALALGLTTTLEPVPSERHLPAMRWLDLNDEHLDTVATELPARLAELESALSVRVGGP
jgi:hypothetical protein